MSGLHAKVKLEVASGGASIDVALDVLPGVTVLFGPSGAGKSLTLACLSGIVKPDAGRIALGEETWFDANEHVDLAIHLRRVAYVFQSLALFPHMTAVENVAYGIGGASKEAAREKARELLAKMHVDHLTDRKPRTFSGGEAQRVALARAFATKPRLLLLDEPFSALDRPTKQALLGEVAAWVEAEKLPTLLVTHDQEEARALGQRVLFIEAGRIVRESTTADAFA